MNKKNLLLSAILLAFLLSCGKDRNSENSNLKDTSKTSGKNVTGIELKDSSQNLSGFYRGTAKDVDMELTIDNFEGKNFSGYTVIFWNPGKGLKAGFTGEYNEQTGEIILNESKDVKGAGYFKGIFNSTDKRIEGDWYRYSDNKTYRWLVRKSSEPGKNNGNKNDSIINYSDNNSSTTGKNYKHFRCFGTEPFWSIEETKQNIVFEKMGEKKVFFKYVDPQSAAGFTIEHMRIYNIDLSKNIILTVKKSKGGCSDGMSDDSYPYEATFQYGGVTYSGCAK
jgi:uncharacterized membrane protein